MHLGSLFHIMPRFSWILYFYFEPNGWLPVDSDIGLLDSEIEEEKWFFLGGIDAYRLIVIDDFSQSLNEKSIIKSVAQSKSNHHTVRFLQ